MAKFERKQNRFFFRGLQLSRASDNLEQYKYSIASNIRTYQDGVIQSRPGQSLYNVTPMTDLNVHTIRRLNNDLPTASQAHCIIVGAGDDIYSDNSAHTAFTSRASGFSGSPLSLVPFRPSDSPEPFMYIADSLKMGKLKVDGTFRNLGIAAPTTPPTAIYQRLILNTYSSLSQGVANGWAIGGTAALTNLAQSRTNTTINRILYDIGSTGAASIEPVSFQEINVGCRPLFGSGGNAETDLVEKVFPASHSSVIEAIAYDSGPTGLCSIVLVITSKEGLIKDACIVLNTEMVRIIDVISGPNDTYSIRTSTTINHIAGETVTGIATFRVLNLTLTHVATETIIQTDHRLTISTGIGQYDNTTNIDLSFIGARPTTPKDFVHIGMKMDLPANLIEGKFMFDVDGSVNDFTRNYYYFAFNANDFTPAVNDQITTLLARQRKIQFKLIDAQEHQRENATTRFQARLNKIARKLRKLQEQAATPPLNSGSDSSARFETVAGASQWTEFFIRLDEDHLTRIGGDTSRGLKDIQSVRIQFNVSAQLIVDLTDVYAGGTYGAEVGPQGTPYIYAYRYRASESGAKSAFSPPMRSGLTPKRQLITLTPATSTDAQVDKIDWVRFGGTLNRWTYLGTQPNSGTFRDEFSDTAILGFPELDFTEGYQPFPVIDLPKSSTVTVVGSSVTRTAGDLFNVNWIPGTDIIINGQIYTLYQVVSTTVLFIVENAGFIASTNCFMPANEIAATPMSAFWGPFGQGESGTVMFACGDVNNPGYLYWTNPDNPDLASDKNFLEVTSPSEPLINGFMFDNKSFVFSSEDLYIIYPASDLLGRLTFKAAKTGLGLGLAGRYSFCISEGKIFFVSRDGIYMTEGHSPTPLTDADLYPLFPHDGIAGTTTNGVSAPDFTKPNSLRLSYGDTELRFEYQSSDNIFHTLIYNEVIKGWVADDYGRPVITSYYEEGKNTHRWLLGSTNGKVYSLIGTSDDGVTLACHLRTNSDDGGDFRSKKKMGDILVDYDSQGSVITVQPGFDNYTVLPAASVISSAGRQQDTIDINSGQWTYARNLALDFVWSSQTVIPKLFGWEFDYIPTPEDTLLRAADADNLGTELPKFIHGFYLHANTYNAAKSFKVQSDTGASGIWTDQETFSITSNGESVQEFSFAIPFITHLIRIIGLDNDPWSLIDYNFIWEPDSPLVTNWISQVFTQGMSGFQHYKDGYISHISTASLSLVTVLDGIAQPAIVIPSSSGIFTKTYIRFPAMKFKTIQYKITSSQGFRLYKSACEIRAKQWASSEAYRVITPIGEQHYTEGPRI